MDESCHTKTELPRQRNESMRCTDVTHASRQPLLAPATISRPSFVPVITTLNGRKVIHNGTAILRAGETFHVAGSPNLIIVTRESVEPQAISATVENGDFQIAVNGFSPGASLSSMANGTLSNGVDVVLLAIVDRIAEMSTTPIYRVQYMMAESA